jgi:RNA polymerase sigma-70 factor (ECF subfamily)
MGATGVDPWSDRALVEAIGAGDREALRSLFDRHAPWLALRLTRRCGDRAIVEETVQDTFVAIWKRPGGYEGRGEVAAWIWGIGIRRLVDRLRRRSFRDRLAAGPQELDSERMPAPSAEEQVLLGIEYGRAAAALDRLSPELRAVLQATVLDGLSTREAAALLGIPQGTVKTRLMRAKAQLREGLT